MPPMVPIRSRSALAVLVATASAAFAQGSAVPATGQAAHPNIVLIVLDDVGLDNIGATCSVAPELQPPCTPNIDALAARGLLFRQAYASPLCSPSRALILTGRYGFRTGVGGLVDFAGGEPGLSAARERILPEVLTGYDSSLVGKWHLADPRFDGLQHPLESGFRYYAGSMFNLTVPPVDFGDGALDCSPGEKGETDYYHWVKTCDPWGKGVLEQTCSRTYATTDTTDEAIARARKMRPPWFLEVAYNAAHQPFQTPPAELIPPAACAFQYGRIEHPTMPEDADAMIEALDHELGRLLAEIQRLDPRAYVLLVSDNGTDEFAVDEGEIGCFDREHSKGTLYQAGIRVPLIVAGADVVPGACDELVSAVDLFATITELAQVRAPAEDSISLVPYLRGERKPLRDTIYTELFRPNFAAPESETPHFAPRRHTRAVLNGRFKLIRFTDENGKAEERLFDLEEDPCEQRNLCPGFGPAEAARLTPLQAANLLALQEELVALGVF
jgi:arylsulfatase A-like enzyme